VEVKARGALIGVALMLAGRVALAADIVIHGAWARPTPPGVSIGALYLSIRNNGARPDVLESLDTPLADRVEIHQSTTVAGVVQMRAQSTISLPPHSTVAISPGGLHLMLLGLKAPLVVGSIVPLNLHLREAGMLAIEVRVEARDQ
jgi:copper(I)-binding protein